MHHHATRLFEAWPFLAAGGALVFAVLAGMILYRRQQQPHRPFPYEGQRPGPLEAEILALVCQRGGPISQPDIAALSGAHMEEVGSVLHNLEARGLVYREWSREDHCYIVSVTQT